MARRSRFSVDLQDLELLQFRLRQLPDKVQNTIFRAGGKKAAKLFTDGAASLTPKSKKKPRKYAGKPHLRDSWISKQKTYGRGAKSRTVFIIGPRSNAAPHAVLVEEGTRPRFTNSRTNYQTQTTKITTKKGVRFRRTKKSVGSKIRDASRTQVYRGVMPAYHPLEKSFSQNKQAAMDVMRRELQQRIGKEAVKR